MVCRLLFMVGVHNAYLRADLLKETSALHNAARQHNGLGRYSQNQRCAQRSQAERERYSGQKKRNAIVGEKRKKNNVHMCRARPDFVIVRQRGQRL